MTDRFDDAIDGAVREMLDVEPRADLRDRVVASAFRRNQGTGVASAFRRKPFVFAAAAAAVILLAVFVAGRSEPVAPQAPVVAHAPDQQLPAEIVAPAPAALETRPAAAAQPKISSRPARRPQEVAAVSFDGDVGGAVTIAPLKRLAPIAIAPITQDSIAPADLSMRALDPINEVQIAPLTPPDRRN